MTSNAGDGTPDVDALRAELAEAKRIGTWLYAHLPSGARRALGDVSEWPWLLDEPFTSPSTPPTTRGE